MLDDSLIRLLWGVRFRGKARLLDRLVPRTGHRSARVFGTRVDLDLADYIQRMMYLGAFEREETALVSRYLRPGMVMVDVGANLGYFTYLAAGRVGPGGRVVAVEPDPVAFARLTAAVRENKLTCVTAVNLALGRTAGKLSLYIPPASHANRAATLVPTPGWEPVPVPIRTLDDLLDELGVEAVDLLKLDVEGFEGEVLLGASRTLAAHRVRAVLCEFNRYWLNAAGSSPDELHHQLTEYGFRPVDGRSTIDPDEELVNRFYVRG